jgi:glycosyltransferase involved in cell wall biosynthesis
MTGTGRLEGRRVVFVLNWAVLGGAERAALGLASHLARVEGADVAFCALTAAEGRGRRAAAELGLPWVPVPVSWGGSAAAKARGLARLAAGLRRLRPDLLLPFCTVPNVLCGLVWRATGARACVWNQRDVALSSRLRPWLVRRAARATPLAIACAQHVADFLVERLGADPERVRVVYSAAELPPARESREAWRARLGLGRDDLAVCVLAHLHRFKDHPTLLRAWRTVCDRLEEDGRSAVLLLAGRPAGTEDALRALSADLGLGRRVRWLGDVEDVGGLVRASDLGALSSRAEGLARGLLECMAGGLAVAGTDVPGIREAVGPAGEPFLAPPGDADGLAAAILRLLGDAELRRRLGLANAERVGTVFSPERTTDAYAALLAELLSAREPGSR